MKYGERVYSDKLTVVREYNQKEFLKLDVLVDLVANIDKRRSLDCRTINTWADYLETVKVPYRITADPLQLEHGLTLWKERKVL